MSEVVIAKKDMQRKKAVGDDSVPAKLGHHSLKKLNELLNKRTNWRIAPRHSATYRLPENS